MKENNLITIKYQGHLFTIDRDELIVSNLWIQFPGEISRAHLISENPLENGYHGVINTIDPSTNVKRVSV